MATIIHFPDRDEREDRQVLEAALPSLVNAGVAPKVAERTIREMLQELREFQSALASMPLAVDADDAPLFHKMLPQIADIVVRAFVRQRNSSALRRLALKESR